jgi:S-adenosylmethionine:tRNA ribosyltransferase-isomerase
VKPARWPREGGQKLLCIDPAAGAFFDADLGRLPALLGPGDLVVVNDAATLPASLRGQTAGGAAVELRLLARDADQTFRAVAFGPGDWRTPTERREAPPALLPGERVTFSAPPSTPWTAPPLAAKVVGVSEISPRLVDLRFEAEGAALWRGLYAAGSPVQYSYLEGPLSLWHVQTSYASRPWAAEAPSAGFALRWGVLSALARRGVRLASLTHAAGLSSTGDEALDAALPLDERYEIPERTARLVAETRRQGGRVVAVGTTVVRALEGSATSNDGAPRGGEGVTTYKLGPRARPRVVDGLLTGLHEPGTSHFSLLEAFAPAALVLGALEHASGAGYQGHEFGDVGLVLRGIAPRADAALRAVAARARAFALGAEAPARAELRGERPGQHDDGGLGGLARRGQPRADDEPERPFVAQPAGARTDERNGDLVGAEHHGQAQRDAEAREEGLGRGLAAWAERGDVQHPARSKAPGPRGDGGAGRQRLVQAQLVEDRAAARLADRVLEAIKGRGRRERSVEGAGHGERRRPPGEQIADGHAQARLRRRHGTR